MITYVSFSIDIHYWSLLFIFTVVGLTIQISGEMLLMEYLQLLTRIMFLASPLVNVNSAPITGSGSIIYTSNLLLFCFCFIPFKYLQLEDFFFIQMKLWMMLLQANKIFVALACLDPLKASFFSGKSDY